MPEAGRRFRLGVEPPNMLIAGEASREDHLQRHLPVQALLARPVNHTHSAAGDLLQEIELPELDGPRRRSLRIEPG
jgi:hypothetical protein